jgi:hypothetical protein
MTTSYKEAVVRLGGIPVATGAKAGGLGSNHNESVRVRSGVKAGTIVLDQ